MSEDGRDSDEMGIAGNTPLVESEYDRSATAPSIAVIKTIASAEDVEPVALSTTEKTTLYEYVDPDALDQILADGNVADVSITFPIAEYTVWVDKNKVVITRGRDG